MHVALEKAPFPHKACADASCHGEWQWIDGEAYDAHAADPFVGMLSNNAAKMCFALVERNGAETLENVYCTGTTGTVVCKIPSCLPENV